jgi:hypothetical protein
MNVNVSLFLTALGLALVLEGLPYFLFAEKMPRVLSMLLEQPPSGLRKLGAGALILGLVLVYFGRQL